MKKTVLLSAAAIISIVISCSKLDTTTSLGGAVVDIYDSTLTKFQNNFYPIELDTSVVQEARSIPTTANAGFGAHSGNLAAGTQKGIEQYGVISFSLSRSFTKKFDSTKTLAGISFVIDTLSDTALSDEVVAYDSSESLLLYTSTSEERLIENHPDMNKNPSAVCRIDTTGPTKFRFAGMATDASLMERIFALCDTFAKCDSCPLTVDSLFYFSVYRPSPTIRWLRVSRMVFHSTNTIDTTDTTKYADTLFANSYNYVAVESDSLTGTLAIQPVSTALSHRIALFKIDMSKLWNSLDSSGFDELLAASVTIDADTFIYRHHDSIATVLPLFVKELIENRNDLSAAFDTAVNNYYSTTNTIDPKNKTLTIQIGRYLQRNLDTRPANFYLYLRIIVPQNSYPTQELFWKKPQVKAVLTTIR